MKKQESKLKIGIDVDDVVLDFFPHFLKYCENRKPPLKVINGMKGHISNWFGLDKNSFRRVHKEFASSDHYDTMPIIPGFVEVFPALALNYNPVLITARSPTREKRTRECIRKQVIGFKLPIYFSREFHGGGQTKGELCRELGVTVQVDDNPDYVDSCISEGVRVFLFDQPWNTNYVPTERVIRVLNWIDIIEKLKSLERKLNGKEKYNRRN